MRSPRIAAVGGIAEAAVGSGSGCVTCIQVESHERDCGERMASEQSSNPEGSERNSSKQSRSHISVSIAIYNNDALEKFTHESKQCNTFIIHCQQCIRWASIEMFPPFDSIETIGVNT